MSILSLNIKASNKSLHLTSQHAVSLRYTLCCRSSELNRYTS
jgi:hypothetical protein